MTEVGGSVDGFGDEVFGSSDGFDGGVAEDEETEESGGKGAAGSVGGGRLDVLADEPVDFSGGEAEEVGGLGVVSGGGDDVEMGVAESEDVGGGFGLGEGLDGELGEGGELGPVGGDPGDGGEKLVVEGVESLGWEEGGSGAGAKDGVEDDGGLEVIPCRVSSGAVEGSEKSRDSIDDFGGAEHADLNSRGREIGGEVVEGSLEEGWIDGLNLADAEGGLDGEGGEGGGSEEAVGGEGLEIGGDAGAAGGIVAGDGQQRADIRGGG